MKETNYCSYCNTELNPHYYFCTRCATPYKEIKTILPIETKAQLTFHERMQLNAPQVGKIFWSYFTFIMAITIGFSLLPENTFPEARLLIPTIGMLALTLYFSIKYFPSLKIQLKTTGFANPWFYIGIGGIIIFLGINWGYHKLISTLLSEDIAFSISEDKQLFSLPLLLIFYSLIPAITEELAFRGLIQRWLISALDIKKGLLLTSALFSLLHFSIISFPYIFLLGLFLGWIKEKTGSLYPVMILHFLHNMIVIMLF